MNKNLDMFSDIIHMTKYRMPNYLVIDTEKYLARILSEKILFVADLDTSQIRLLIEEKYGNVDNAFHKYGRLTTIELNKIKYYQPEIGIEGPKNTGLNDPINIISYKNVDILF